MNDDNLNGEQRTDVGKKLSQIKKETLSLARSDINSNKVVFYNTESFFNSYFCHFESSASGLEMNWKRYFDIALQRDT